MNPFCLNQVQRARTTAGLHCVWIETGNPLQPLACVWVDPEVNLAGEATADDAVATGEDNLGKLAA